MDKTTAIINIGTAVSGILDDPIIDADALLIRDGAIASVGSSDAMDLTSADTTLDVGGATVIPGLIDCHTHPLFGDWSPRLRLSGYIDWAVHGGVTSMISAGEVHLPGRPQDPAGVKALAILAHKSYTSIRPSGVKVHAGAVILEHGLSEQDFQDMAREGVWLVGEIGIGGLEDPSRAKEMVQWAKASGMMVMMHAGGLHTHPSRATTAKDVRTVDPDVISHINGGTTAMDEDEIDILVRETDMTMELVLSGNPRIRSQVLDWMSERGELNRILLGVDAPGGSGIPTMGMLRQILEIVSMDNIPPGVAIAMATGNTAEVYDLPTGSITRGRAADLVVLDAPLGSSATDALGALERGDMPGISAVIVDGDLVVHPSRFSAPPKRKVEVVRP